VKKKILLTRPRASSERWAILLARHGFDCVIEPLLILMPTQAPRPLGIFQAVMITSANAVDTLQDRRETISDLFQLPCFCIGSTTSEAARNLGFTDIHTGVADGASLAQTIVQTFSDKTLSVLHIAGDIVDGRTHDILSRSGIPVTLWPVYRANAVEDFTMPVRTQFKTGQFAAIPIFSPRSARIFVSIVEKNHLAPACHSMVAVGLSQAVADVLQTLPWRRLCVAKTPTEEDVLACLQLETSMIETKPLPPLTPPLVRSAHMKKSRGWLWGILGIVLVAAVGSFVILQCPWTHNPAKQSEATQGKSHDNKDIAALDQRLQLLEAHLDAQNETAATAQKSSPTLQNSDAQIATLNAAVKNLQMQMTQLQGQAQKAMVAAFAFSELREAIHSGTGFASQLAAWRAAANGDTDLSKTSEKLEPYASRGVQTLPQLHELLTAQEMKAATPEIGEVSNGWKEHIKSILQNLIQNLISVHSLHDPQFLVIEQKLDAGDAQGALNAFDGLPSATQQQLTAWREQLQARLTVDDAVRAIGVHLMTPPMSDSGSPTTSSPP
jgi:uroporphyrinogen-III synthase